MKCRHLFQLVAFVAVLIASAGQVQAAVITIDFDGFAPSSPFGGGVEDGFIVGSISGPVAVNGDYLGPRSGINSIHHDADQLASFSLSNTIGEKFTLSSFFAGSAFGGADPLTLKGYLNGSLVGTDVFDPNPPSSYMFFTPTNLSGVIMDLLVFEMGPAGPGPTHIDDIELNTIELNTVPEPTSMAIFGLGTFAMVYRARRKSKA